MSKKAKKLDAGRFHWKMGLLDRQRAELVRQLREECPAYYPVLGGEWTFARTDIPYQELWARVHWTPEATRRITEGEYRYLSAEFDLDHQDVANGNRIGAALTAVGLTNRPFVKGMAPVEPPDPEGYSWVQILATGEWHHPIYGKITIEPRHFTEMRRNVRLVQASIRTESEHPNTDLMVDYNHGSLWSSDPEGGKAAGWIAGENLIVRTTIPASDPPSTDKENLMTDEQIRQLLKLPAEQALTDEHPALAEAALVELIALRDAPPPVVEEPPEPTSTPATSEPPELVQLREQVAAGQQAIERLALMEAQETVRLAIEARQVTPAQQAWAEQYALRDKDGFAAYLEATGPIVPLGREGAGGEDHREESEQIRAFVADQQKNNIAFDEAQRRALKKFGKTAFDEYRQAHNEAR